ncbi:MAG: hypothetical protein ACRDRL_07375, partial [Sciscionella sp.]
TLPGPTGPVLRGAGGGDGGLFAGILARYLAQAVLLLPDCPARTTAAGLVLRTAEGLWHHAIPVAGGALFGPDPTRAAETPSKRGSSPERDLSTQTGAWMSIEAAALLQATGDIAAASGASGLPIDPYAAA